MACHVSRPTFQRESDDRFGRAAPLSDRAASKDAKPGDIRRPGVSLAGLSVQTAGSGQPRLRTAARTASACWVMLALLALLVSDMQTQRSGLWGVGPPLGRAGA